MEIMKRANSAPNYRISPRLWPSQSAMGACTRSAAHREKISHQTRRRQRRQANGSRPLSLTWFRPSGKYPASEAARLPSDPEKAAFGWPPRIPYPRR
jgi:hypothetical protein